jgi:dolichyl-phosphate beta-glucosyltransferase
MAEHPSSPYLSVVIPAYNEERRIDASLRDAWAYLEQQPYRAEIILADDGSTDRTAALADLIASQTPQVRVLRLSHGGKASAIRHGLRASQGEVVAFMDADLATPVSYLARFLERIQDGADIAIGSREGAGSHRVGEPEYRHIMGRVFNRLVQVLLLPGIHDTQCGFKVFRRTVVMDILQRARLYAGQETITGARVTAFDVELLVIARRLGLRIDEVPVVWTYGTHSKVNPIRDTLQNLRDIMTVAWTRARRGYD